ncbi:MAG: nucleotide exchange factor GrpE [Candidatus Parcubacteria bacterium]|nr:nucleotide exchange factor GrpE [Candidatus Parcubacteria bacterium]
MVEEDTTKEELNNKEQPFDSAQGKLKELELKCDEYLNNWKRERADFLNYKKEELERVRFLGKYVKEDIIFKILPILDNFYLAEKQLPESLKTKAKGSSEKSPQIEWTRGFLQIHKQIEEFLKKEGIEEIKTIGEKFNPETMEAVGEAESSDIGTTEGSDEGTVEEIQKGYKIDGKVLRPAKVKVTK